VTLECQELERFRKAGWVWTRILDALGMAGLTMPWRRVYVHPDWWGREDLARHELVHLEQIERDGALLFSVRYLWWLLRYGYRGNPYEIEAYERTASSADSTASRQI